MNVRIDDRRWRRTQLGQQRVVALEVPAGIHDNRVTVTHQHITQRPLPHAIELNHVRQGRGGGEERERASGVP